jgi:hypothetical protein
MVPSLLTGYMALTFPFSESGTPVIDICIDVPTLICDVAVFPRQINSSAMIVILVMFACIGCTKAVELQTHFLYEFLGILSF